MNQSSGQDSWDTDNHDHSPMTSQPATLQHPYLPSRMGTSPPVARELSPPMAILDADGDCCLDAFGHGCVLGLSETVTPCIGVLRPTVSCEQVDHSHCIVHVVVRRGGDGFGVVMQASFTVFGSRTWATISMSTSCACVERYGCNRFSGVRAPTAPDAPFWVLDDPTQGAVLRRCYASETGT